MTSETESAPSTEFRQARFMQPPLEFKFQNDYLAYQGSMWSFNVHYSNDSSPLAFKRQDGSSLPSYFLLMYTLVALLCVSHNDGPQYGVEGLRWLLRMAIPFVLSFLAATAYWKLVARGRYTVIPTTKGDVLVLRGRNHDAIIDRIAMKRMVALRSMAKFDPANSMEEEKAKLRWLLSEGALTEDEALFLQSRLPTHAA